MNDPIDRQAAIDEIKALYEWHDTVTEDRAIDHLKRLPSAQPDLSDFCDRLWKAAYERGKAEAQAEIVRCKDCIHRDPEDKKCDCGHDILWQLPRDDKWYCADAERRTDE
jgi:hypothetical protein